MRSFTTTVLNDTSLFDSHQLQPRAALSLIMRCWTQAAYEQLGSFPVLLREYGLGVVVVGASLRYERPFQFLDAPAFVATSQLELVRDDSLFWGEIQLESNKGRFMTIEALGRPVKLDPDATWAAKPTRVEPPVLDRFDPEQRTDRRVRPPVPGILTELRSAPVVCEHVMHHRISRHDCEVADQWSFIEIGALAATARELLVLGPGRSARLGRILAHPVGQVDLHIHRPMFLHDELTISTEVRAHADAVAFVHRFSSEMAGGRKHAIVVERFELPGGPA